jgi:hypothetical protein
MFSLLVTAFAESALDIISVFHSREMISCNALQTHCEGHLEQGALTKLAAPCRQNDWGLFTLPKPSCTSQRGKVDLLLYD